jgi:hypoxanthine phosphoribosyltransferase
LLPAGALGYALSVKNTYTLNVEFYTGIDERLPMPIMLPPVPSLVDVSGARILVVDDVADTGRTLKLVNEFCEGKVADSKIAVLYEKPHSEVKCDFVWRYTDKWVNFPWSDKDPVVTRMHVRDA